ncbi:MAG TPA: trypsin-like peptidase domain-containing protein [Candidatus Acidoferrales bacterium]|nr:trypsin-like peptidase domain-containing protein [Candidatus Acidoferrales bacterium]
MALLLAVAILSGGVAAGVTLAVLRQQSRTNPPNLDLGSRVTISEDSAVQRAAAAALPAVVSVVTAETAGGDVARFGSGFLVTSDGFLVTNVQVVANASGLTVLLHNDLKRHDARLVDFDCETGVAVLKIDQVAGLPTLSFGDSSALKLGQTVIAVGGPLSSRDSVTRGIVAAVHRPQRVAGPVAGREAELSDTIQTDAAIGPGNSGGPLLNVGGQVVGLAMAARSGEQDVGFAISTAGLQPEVEQIVQSGQLTVPSLGLQTSDLGPDQAAFKGEPVGALVRSVLAGGPGAAAGLRAGDVVTQLDEVRLDAAHPLAQTLRTRFRPAQRVVVTYWRAGAASQVQLTLAGSHPRCP